MLYQGRFINLFLHKIRAAAASFATAARLSIYSQINMIGQSPHFGANPVKYQIRPGKFSSPDQISLSSIPQCQLANGFAIASDT